MDIEFVGLVEHPYTCITKGETYNAKSTVAHFKIDNQSVFLAFNIYGNINLYNRRNMPDIFLNHPGPIPGQGEHAWAFNFFTQSEITLVNKYKDDRIKLCEILKEAQSKFSLTPIHHELTPHNVF